MRRTAYLAALSQEAELPDSIPELRSYFSDGYSPRQAADRAVDLHQARTELLTYSEQVKRTTAILGGKLKLLKTIVETVEREVVDGRVPREVPCTATLRKATEEDLKRFDDYRIRDGVVDIRRSDTGEIVETRGAMYEEIQGAIGFDDDTEEEDDEEDGAA